MKVSLSDVLDRYSIAVLKRDRANADNLEEIKLLENEIENYKENNFEVVKKTIIDLLDINGQIWDLESDIRLGKENILGLEEVGRRAIKIRDLNKIRITHKNKIVELFKEGFKDIKVNHASE
jgi:hypothetical protein